MRRRGLVLALALTLSLIPRPAEGAASRVVTLATCTSSSGPGLPAPATPPLKQDGYHAAWWGQSGYMTLCPGDKATATVAYYNAGSLGWVQGKLGQAAYLGTWGPDPGQDRASVLGGDGTTGSPNTGWPRFNRIAQQPAAFVGPGQVAWFQFAVLAPMTPGMYFLGLRPLVEGAAWMEDFGVFWLVTVLNPDGSRPTAKCFQCWPLSGMPLAGGDPTRRPLSVKIDNSMVSRPHYGIGKADQVWEILVEGYVTRLNLVFHSQEAANVGSVRSGRLWDRYLTPALRGALAYSGATIEELAFFRQDVIANAYVDVGAATSGASAYYRVDFRVIPHNEFTSTGSLRSALSAQGKSNVTSVPDWGFTLPMFDADLASNGMPGSVGANAISIPYRPGADVRYTFDPQAKTYARWQNGVREVDGDNDQPVAAKNVVIIYTDIFPANPPIVEDNLGSLGLDERTIGSGACTVFQQGRRQDCTWSRATILDPFVFTNFYQQRILLSPGQTWFHVVPKDWQVPSS